MSGPDEQSLDSAAHQSVSELFSLLRTDANGLESHDALARTATYGKNILAEPKGTSQWIKLLQQFTHPMALLLWAGGIIGFAAKMPQLAIAVWLVNIINGVFSFYQEFKAEQATKALKKLLGTEATVVRDGREVRMNSELVVPGDILALAEGDRIVADLYLFESHAFNVDQSNFTGESKPVKKYPYPQGAPKLNHAGTPFLRTEYPNLVFASTSVVSGSGRGVVLRTGMRSEFGKVADLTQNLKRDISPLQIEVERTTKFITAIAVIVGVIFYVSAYLVAKVTMMDAFIFALGMVVAFVPEGMLPLVTLCLAVGTQRMSKRNVVVKKLSSVETLGSCTVICSDKTGTLTQNELTVKKLWVSGRIISVGGVGFEPTGTFNWEDTGAEIQAATGVLRQTLLGFGLCNNAKLQPPDSTGKYRMLGDPTEGALKVAALKGGLDLNREAATHVRINEIPFSSNRRKMSTIHEITEPGGHRRLMAFCKGSADELIGRCTRVQWTPVDEREMDHEMRTLILEAVDAIARKGLRVLALATRDLPEEDGELDEDMAENDMVFLGLAGMMDPPRLEVPLAVETCHRAGIRVIMITGDYGLTAESIARQIGLQSKEGKLHVVTGHDLSSMDDQQLRAVLREDCIFARVVPADKLRVVQTLQAMGETVAVTGDGVNDAPALKQANIGVAMGITGTDVAKDAADMILTDDNFASIVAAVEEGRGVYSNIRKFLTYILTSNVAEASPFIFYVFSRGRIPLALNVMQVLAIDLGTDMIPALALGCDPPEATVMLQPPRSKNDHLINGTLLFRVFGPLGIFEACAAMVSFYFHYWTHGYEWKWIDLPRTPTILHSAQTTALLGVVFAQIGNLFACRTESTSIFSTSLFDNSLIWIGIVAELCLVAALTYIPFLQSAFQTHSIPFYPHWVFCMTLWFPLILLSDEIRKLVWWRVTRNRPVRKVDDSYFGRPVDDSRISLIHENKVGSHDYV